MREENDQLKTKVLTIETVKTKRKPVHFDNIYSLDSSTTRCSTEHKIPRKDHKLS